MMHSAAHPNGECVMAEPKKRFKVLSSEYSKEKPELGLLEVVGEDSKLADGLWALNVGAVPIDR